MSATNADNIVVSQSAVSGKKLDKMIAISGYGRVQRSARRQLQQARENWRHGGNNTKIMTVFCTTNKCASDTATGPETVAKFPERC